MNLIETILSPFIFIIKHLFLFSYSITDNYGVSIILLSFAISLLLLPIFIFIEKVKKRDDAVKLKMKPLIDEIKRCYKGQERFYYLKTINRQHNYSPAKALVPILSLLIQIPFFIAAYQFLEHFEPLKNISFLFINDLSAPDALFGSINILPIAMTFVNLATAWFYTRTGNTDERKQMVVVAAIFLVLLFKLPAGLVLYWTMNNIFSFFRLFITNPEVFKKIEHKKKPKTFSLQIIKNRFLPLIPILKQTFITISTILILFEFIKSFQYGFSNILQRLIIDIAIGLTATFSIALINLLHNIATPPKHAKFKEYILHIWPTFKPLFFILASIAVYSQVNWAMQYNSYNNIILRVPSAIIGSAVITSIFALIALIYQGHISIKSIIIDAIKRRKERQFRIHPTLFLSTIGLSVYFYIAGLFYFTGANKTLYSYAIVMTIISLLIGLFYFLRIKNHKKISIQKPTKSMYFVFSLSLFYILGLVFFWNPLIVYSSFPETFSFPAIKLLTKNFYLFAIIFSVVYGLFVIVPKQIKFLLTITLVTLSFISFANSFIIPINVGSLQLGRYINDSNLAMQPSVYIIEAFSILLAFLIVKWVLYKGYIKQISITLLFLTLILISQSLITATKTGDFFQKIEDSLNLPSSISFSKNKENIVYIIPDMFLGMYMKYILEELPELKKELDGFVWYPNTLAISTNTTASISAMHCGFDFNIDKLNEDKTRTLTQKITEASKIFVTKIKSKDFYLTSSDMVFSQIDKSKFDSYLPTWHTDWNKWNNYLKIGGVKELDYTILWKNALFYSLPLFLKPQLYKKGKWINVDDETNKNTKASQRCNFIRLLPKISDTKNSKKSFVYIHSEATHLPWNIVNDEGKIFKNVSSYENQKWFLIQFAKWINWMKENKIYDNTKIILVSDHSHYLPKDKLDSFGDTNRWNKQGIEKLSAKNFWRVNSLLLVKDFKAKGEIKEDWRFMSNADIPAIVFDENDPTKTEPIKDRTLPVYFVEQNLKITSQKKLNINMHFNVKNYIYNPDNWQLVK